MSFSELNRCWVLAGPTAAGKSAAAMVLAQQLNAEIVALDSMTLYRGMDVGTAKPTADEQAAVPHHLIDVLDASQEISVTEYLSLAQEAARAIVSRGKVPLFVGGTGLYLRSLLRGVFAGPPADWDLRQKLEAEARQIGPEAFLAKLAAVDQVTAGRLHANDLRRIVRALEVYETTGQPISSLQEQTPKLKAEQPVLTVWISPPRDWLHERINQRVIEMFNCGWAEEAWGLFCQRPCVGKTARQALGYQQMFDYWTAEGHQPLETVVPASIPPELTNEIQTATRQFAKRQMTWFRNLEECRELAINGSETPEAIASRVIGTAKETS
jgi:tRNA dimethylallyltransferase